MNIYKKLTVLVLCLMSKIGFAIELSEPDYFPSGEFILPVSNQELGDYSSKVVVGSRDFQKLREFSPSSELYNDSKRVAVIFIISDTTGTCTGSLVGPDLLLTNHHCAFSNNEQTALKHFFISFDYYQDNIKNLTKLPMYRFTKLIKANKNLDYALYKLDQRVGDEKGWFELETNNSSYSNIAKVKIIQHPKGRSKEVVLRNNHIKHLYLNNAIIHYLADTEGGSSGSPVFAENGNKIIALHHAGISNNQRRGVYNEGILSSYIYREIKNYLPKQRVRQQPRTPAPVRQPTPATPKPAPVKPKPQKTNCEGKGLAVTDDDGNLKCVKW